MAKFPVYVPDDLLESVERARPEVAHSHLAQIGAVHVLAGRAKVGSAAVVRAFITAESTRRHPNLSLIDAACHALAVRHADRFVCGEDLPDWVRLIGARG